MTGRAVSSWSLKLIAMVTLTLLIFIPVLSLARQVPCPFIVPQILRFLQLKLLLVVTFAAQNFIFKQPMGLGGALKLGWCTALLAIFLMFVTSMKFFLQIASKLWGQWPGRFVLVSFSALWVYTVFSFCFSGCRTEKTEPTERPLGVCSVPVATQRATGLVIFVAIAFIYSASCGLIPNFSAHILTFLQIWLSWMIIFTVSFYNLIRDEQLESFPQVDFNRVSGATCWNLTLMAAMVALAITIYRELHHSRFHIGDYYCFCFAFLVISVLCIRLFRRVGSG